MESVYSFHPRGPGSSPSAGTLRRLGSPCSISSAFHSWCYRLWGGGHRTWPTWICPPAPRPRPWKATATSYPPFDAWTETLSQRMRHRLRLRPWKLRIRVSVELMSISPATERAECLAPNLNERLKEVENLFAHAVSFTYSLPTLGSILRGLQSLSSVIPSIKQRWGQVSPQGPQPLGLSPSQP